MQAANFALVPFSEAARVASPKCDQRYNAHSTAAATTTMPVSQNRSAGIRAPNMVTRPCGSTDGILVAAASDHHVERGRRLVAPAALEDEVDRRLRGEQHAERRDGRDDSGEELRSGRKTTVSTTTPKTTVPASARTSATAVASPSEVSHRNRLRGHHRAGTGGEVDDPGPAGISATARPIPAMRAPVPRPRTAKRRISVHQRSGAAAAATTRSFLRTVHSVSPSRSSPAPEEFDPVSEQGFRDPASLLTRAREEAPVFFYEPLGVWVISRREDVDRCIADAATFSSTSISGSLDVPEHFLDRVPPALMAKAFIGMDPPEHTPIRKTGQRGFTRPRVAALEPRIEDLAVELVDGFAGDGACDLMQAFCLDTSRPARSRRCSICPSATTRCSAACASTTSSSWTADAIRCPRRCATRCGSATPPPTSGCASWPTSAPRTRVTTSSRR